MIAVGLQTLGLKAGQRDRVALDPKHFHIDDSWQQVARYAGHTDQLVEPRLAIGSLERHLYAGVVPHVKDAPDGWCQLAGSEAQALAAKEDDIGEHAGLLKAENCILIQ